MKKLLLLSAFAIILLSFGCKSDREKERVIMDGQEKIVLPSNEDRLAGLQSKTPIKIPDTPSDKPQFLLKGYWEAEFFLVVGEKPTKEFQKHWIKFNDNFTFDSGNGSEKLVSGKWHYKETDVQSIGQKAPLLTLSSTGMSGFEGLLNHDWRIQTNNSDMMIFIGNAIENNTGSQVKFVWHSEMPK
ncbi:MAG: hypothetical protein KBA06_03555 [Saprospiraceae bacterium]|nr:hypothetical protein [Saprospiraceae bacterium]